MLKIQNARYSAILYRKPTNIFEPRALPNLVVLLYKMVEKWVQNYMIPSFSNLQSHK